MGVFVVACVSLGSFDLSVLVLLFSLCCMLGVLVHCVCLSGLVCYGCACVSL